MFCRVKALWDDDFHVTTQNNFVYKISTNTVNETKGSGLRAASLRRELNVNSGVHSFNVGCLQTRADGTPGARFNPADSDSESDIFPVV